MYLKDDIHSCFGTRYGDQGDKVKVIMFGDHISIVEQADGNRFTVHSSDLSENMVEPKTQAAPGAAVPNTPIITNRALAPTKKAAPIKQPDTPSLFPSSNK
jgi:hypothetical protein